RALPADRPPLRRPLLHDAPALQSSRRVARMKSAALAVLFAATQALALSSPSKPVKLLVGVPPGGPTDTVARAIAPELGEALGQPIVIENRPGASAVIATDAVAKAAPDGHTLAFIYITHATNPTLIAKLPYDTLRDFAPVSLVGRQSMVLLAHPGFAAGTLADTGAQRTTLAPGIPTLAESGLAGYEAYGWYGVAAPARTPAAVIARLHAEVARIAQNPAMKARLGAQGLELVGNSPPEFDAFIRAAIAKWNAGLNAAGIKPG